MNGVLNNLVLSLQATNPFITKDNSDDLQSLRSSNVVIKTSLISSCTIILLSLLSELSVVPLLLLLSFSCLDTIHWEINEVTDCVTVG